MDIDKALYEAPAGLAALNDAPIEVEIENPDSVSIDVDGIEVEIEPRGKERTGIKEFTANLAEHFEESAMQELAEELIGHFDDDKRSRKDWEKTYKMGLDLLGLKIENRTEPWPGACGVYHPILTEATVRFQSEAIMETFPPRGPVKAKILGKEDMLAEKAAERVKDYI